MKTLVFPEGQNPFIIEAAEQLAQFCHPVLLQDDLVAASNMLVEKSADAMVAGIDYSSRDVILQVRDTVGVPKNQKTFSSLFVAELPDGRTFILSDGATCKNPSAEQLADIVLLVHAAAQKILQDTPRIAMLSFSTLGSGGHDPSMAKINESIQIAKSLRPEIEIDGEMQLDAAVDPRIARKKAPNSSVAGRANVLIAPDINSGNILYKSLEQFAGATVAGPVLLGFNAPVTDLSRGSTVKDIVASAKIVLKLAE